MKDHPILMNGEMVRAHMAGRKTQTRRPVKPQPPAGFEDPCQGHDGQWFVMDGRPGAHLDSHPLRSPFGVAGDRLWGRETWGVGCRPCPQNGWRDGVEYRADEALIQDDPHDILPLWSVTEPDGVCLDDYSHDHWLSPMTMPRWASRLTLTVKRVWAERVTAIGHADLIAEGIEPLPSLAQMRGRFANLWDGIYAKGGLGWDANPWVWACEFEVSE